ncbi:flagellar biosynthetic protein FliR [Fodinibius sediminis]|uniref:Flagellar biosynthetic protein FliR n=1 Tax=Fodinibius sediminis TaxID=1214077 RepID=A0A521CIA4_9BACT|nr:flagellar biosynthetic protein FliR [Fodinibius sediminis]SMO59122.1 flagellar biosynthetic protein FliR [Fodinibius sediminis]
MTLFSVEMILTGFLIFVRVSALVGSAPFFSNGSIPVRVKIFFAIVLTVMLYPIVPIQGAGVPVDVSTLELVILIIKELLVGTAMGLVGQIIFAGLQMGGELMSVNVGLSFASVVDPVNQSQGSIISQLFGLLGILVFIGIGGDTLYIQALARSFDIVPIGGGHIAMAGPSFIQMATYLFVVGVQMAAPFMIVLFLLDLSFAIFARIMPQANIFFIALPLKLGIGIILLILILPYTPAAFDQFFQKLWDFLDRLIHAIS